MSASSLPERGTWVFPQEAFVKVSSYLLIYFYFLVTRKFTIVLISKINDEVSVVLGCDLPILLRPRGSNQYEVVGPCFVHGLMLGEALKPPLEPPWKDVLPVARGWALSYFLNAQTGELLKSDPRLGLLPTDWEEVATLDPFLPPFVFKNKKNGLISMNDPRMSAEAIEQRGIVLETFELI